MRPQTAWSIFSKLLVVTTHDISVGLDLTPGGDLILNPPDARLTVVSGPYTGSCFRDGTVLFNSSGVRVPLCDLPVQTLPLYIRYKNTTLYSTDEEWARTNADTLNAVAVQPIPLLYYDCKSAHVLQQTTGDVRLLLSQVFTFPITEISVAPIAETVETSEEVLDALAAEIATCEDELMCVAIQSIAQRLGRKLEIPAAAIAATDAAMQVLPQLAAYEPFSTTLSMPQLRTYVGSHNFDIRVQDVYLEKDVKQQTRMRTAARQRGGMISPRATPPPPELIVNGQRDTAEVQPYDQLLVENVSIVQVYLDGVCIKCVPGNTLFTLEKCGSYTINKCITVNVAYNIANVSSWRIVTDDALQHIQIIADDRFTTKEAVEMTRWRFQSDVTARFNTTTVPLKAVEVGVYCMEPTHEELWRLVSVSGADVTMQVCYGRLTTSKLWVNLGPALSRIERPAALGPALLGSAYGDLFPFIDPTLLNRARTVCSGGLWSQSDGRVESTGVSTVSAEDTAAWLMNECDVQHGSCKVLVPGTMEALRRNDVLLPFILSNGERDQLVGFTTLPLPQYMPLYVSGDIPVMHNLSGINLKWADGFHLLVLECGLHVCNKPSRHERLVRAENGDIHVQVTHPEAVSLVLLPDPGCYAFVHNQQTYIYNVVNSQKAFIVHGIVSEPQSESTLSMFDSSTPYFTQKPACLPLDIDTHEVTSCWGTGLRGVDVLEGKLTGLLPPFTPSASMVLHPSCNSKTPSGLVPCTFQHDLFSCLFTVFGYDPDSILPWAVFPAYEPYRTSAKFQTMLTRALCNHPISMMQCCMETHNPYPDTCTMQLRVPSTVLVTHASEWTPVSLACVVDGYDVFVRGVCISDQGALFAAIRDLPQEHSHCIALTTVPKEAALPKAVQLLLRCFLIGDPISVTLPALLFEKEVIEYEEDPFTVDDESDN